MTMTNQSRKMRTLPANPKLHSQNHTYNTYTSIYQAQNTIFTYLNMAIQIQIIRILIKSFNCGKLT